MMKQWAIKLLWVQIFLMIAVVQCSFAGKEQQHDLMKVQDSVVQIVSRLYSEGNYKKIIELAEKNDTATFSSKLFYYYGMSYTALYNYPKAQEYFQKIFTVDSTTVNYHFQYARLLLQSGFADEAIEELKTCIALDSTYLPASFQLGLMYNSQKRDPELEVEIFSFLIRQNHSDFLSLYYKGDALKRLGLADSGIVFIQQSIEINSRYFPSLVAMANYQNSKKEYTEALKFYQKALAIRSKDKDVLFQIGECYRKTSLLKHAIPYFNRAIQLDSLTALFHAQLGYTYYLLRQYDSAITAYNTAIYLDGDNTQYCLNLALVFQRLDSTEGVIQAYHKGILSCHLENGAIVYNDLAAYYFQKRRWADAVKSYQKVVELNSDKDMALYWIGVSFFQMADKKSALLTFEKCLQKTEGDTSKTEFRKDVKNYINFFRMNKE